MLARSANGEDKLMRLNAATNPTSTTHSSSRLQPLPMGQHQDTQWLYHPHAPPTMSAPSLTTVVAGIVIGGVPSTAHGTKRRHGERDKDRVKRAKRKCCGV